MPRHIPTRALGLAPTSPLCDANFDAVCDSRDARRALRLAVGALAKDDLRCAERP